MASNVIAVITELLLGQWGVAPKVMLVGDVHTQPRLAFKAFVPRADHHPGELAPLPRTKARGGMRPSVSHNHPDIARARTNGWWFFEQGRHGTTFEWW